MPEDVPVDQPPRELTEQAWRNWFWIWDAYIGIAYVAVLVVLFTANIERGELVVAIGSLTITIALYAALGRRLIQQGDDRSAQSYSFSSALLVLFLVAILANPTSSFALFWLCPMLFMALPTRSASLLLVVINLLPAAVTVWRGDDVSEVFVKLGPVAAMTVVLSIFMGIWIERIVHQSTKRAELIEQLEASRAEVSRLSHEAGVAAERARLAGEIHDTLAQGFTSIITLVQAAESELDGENVKARKHLDLAARTARENLAESRALVAALAPFALGEGSLPDSVQRQVTRVEEETGMAAAYRTDGEPRPLATAVEVVLLRAAQEALTNVRRHAGASAVRVTLAFGETTVRLTVCDDGVGHDPGAPTDGFGLRGMRARVEQVAGTVTVRGEPGKGTTLDVEVPG